MVRELYGCSVLIIENEVGTFITALQAAFEGRGAESLVARNPAIAFERCEQFNFTAAAISAQYAYAIDAFTLPTLVYGTGEMPRDPHRIVHAVIQLLGRSG